MIASVSIAGARQAARLIAVAAEQMGEIGGRLEVPALAALGRARDAASGIVLRQSAKRSAHVADPDMHRDRIGGQRLGRGEQHRLDRADEIVGRGHAASIDRAGRR